MEAPEFSRFVFGEGGDFGTIETGRARIERRNLGSVELPDGKIYACDPFVPMDLLPFSSRLVPGSYDVVLFVAVRIESEAPPGVASRTELNVAAALLASAELPVSWKPASRDGGDADGAPYGVDSGTGCWMGSVAAEAVVRDDDARDALLEQFKDSSGTRFTFENGATIAAFSSGIGDGVYASWLGYDAHGGLAMLVTDFDLLMPLAEVSKVHAQWAKRAAKKWWQFWK